MTPAQGKISVHVRGFGFLELDDGENAFVAPPALNALLAGDRVRARVEPSGDGRFQAFDLELLSRERLEVIGTVVRRQGELSLRLDPRLGNGQWRLHGTPKGLRNEALVIAEAAPDRAEARFVGTVGAAGAALTGLLVVHGIRREFPAGVIAQAERTRPRVTGRRDLRDVVTITIDAAHSKDLDDALAVLPVQADGAIRVLVSIADVDAGVPAGSAVDQEARRRGTSVYLPEEVVPMLPPVLSEQVLSLLPGEDRLAVTVELRIDAEGGVTATDLTESRICSTARLTYDEVADYLDRGVAGRIPEPVRATLRWLRAAAGRLSAVRATRGGVELERDEVELKLDADTGEPSSVDARQLTSAHQLVERLMVATNEAVARWLIDRGLPGLFRVQDEPDPDQLDSLATFAANFGFETAFGGRLTPLGLAAFEEQFRTSHVAPSIRTVMRWCLGRARYSPAPAPHFALAAPIYLHFTSPIRRYPDLVVHRVVKAHLRGERDDGTAGADLTALAAALSDAARRAQRAETERLRMLLARLFATRIGERHDANIVSVKPWGLVVQLAGLGVTGTVTTDALPDGPYHLDEATHSLVGPRRRYLVGAPLPVVVEGVDEALGRLDLVPQRQTRRRRRS